MRLIHKRITRHTRLDGVQGDPEANPSTQCSASIASRDGTE